MLIVKVTYCFSILAYYALCAPQAVILIYLTTIAKSSPQVNHKIYSEEDLLAIDSSPQGVVDQLAVETFSDVKGTAVLPPPSFNPSGETNNTIKILKSKFNCRQYKVNTEFTEFFQQ